MSDHNVEVSFMKKNKHAKLYSQENANYSSETYSYGNIVGAK